MAEKSRIVQVIYRLRDEASKGVNKMKSAFISLSKVGIGVATAALAGFTLLAKKSIGAYAEQEKQIGRASCRERV